MTNPLKELLERLMENGDVQVGHLHCEVEQNISRLQTKMADIPNLEASDSSIMRFAVDHIHQAAKSLKKDSRKRELEMEMRMLDKPDNFDMEGEENQHTVHHIEEEQLQTAVMRREAEALLKFCDLMNAQLDD